VDIVHVEKSGCFNVDVVLKSLFTRVGKLSDNICNCLDDEITMKVIILNIPWCVDTILHSVQMGSGVHPASLVGTVKQPGLERNHSHASGAEVMNGGAVPPLSPLPPSAFITVLN
jgi:hypothetical protein